jgi:Exocyst complex component Sec10
VQVFVNQHDFFIVREKLETQKPILWTTEMCASLIYKVLIHRFEKLSDPDIERPPSETGLVNLCNEIRSIVEQEALIIGEVFLHPSTVMQVFLERIFLQSVFIFFYQGC